VQVNVASQTSMLNETTPSCSWLCFSSLSAYNHAKTSGYNTPSYGTA